MTTVAPTRLQRPSATPAAPPSTHERTPQRPGSRRFGPLQEAGAVGLILLLALALRAPHLTLVPRFTDESLEVLWSLPIAQGASFPLTNYDAYYGSLFNYLVAGSFLVLGPSAQSARLVVLVAGVLTVLATYALARAWGGTAAGLVGAALMAVSSAHVVINSHIAWSNCITPLFTTLAIWTLWSGSRAGDGRSPTHSLSHSPVLLPISGLLWGLALQTHPAVATLLPGAAAYVVWKGRHLLRTPWPYLAVASFLVGYGNVIAHNLGNHLESITTAQRLRQEYASDQDAATSYSGALVGALLLLVRVLGGAVDSRDWPWGYLADLPVLLGSALAVAGLVLLARRGNPLPLLLALTCLALLPALNPKFRTLISSRYLMPLAPILLAAIAVVLTSRPDWLTANGLDGRVSVRRPSSFILRLLPIAAALVLLLGPLIPLWRYYERAFASGDTNQRAYLIAAQVGQLGHPGEPLVLDESFGTDGAAGVDEQRAVRYLLAFRDVPVRVLKITARRLEDELDVAPSLLVIVNGRQLRELDRLPLEPLTGPPRRGGEEALFRLDRGSR